MLTEAKPASHTFDSLRRLVVHVHEINRQQTTYQTCKTPQRLKASHFIEVNNMKYKLALINNNDPQNDFDTVSFVYDPIE